MKRGTNEYRICISGFPTPQGWAIIEEHSICVDLSTDLSSLKKQLDQLCEPPVTYQQAMTLLADRAARFGTARHDSQPQIRNVLAPRRARIIDGLVLMPLAFLQLAAFGSSISTPLRLMGFLVAFTAPLAYVIWMHGKFGQTFGKMAAGVIVRDISEARLSMKQAVLRNIVDLVLTALSLPVYIPLVVQGINFVQPGSTPAAVWVLGYLSFGWTLIDALTLLTNKKRRALHDFISGSVVIQTGTLPPGESVSGRTRRPLESRWRWMRGLAWACAISLSCQIFRSLVGRQRTGGAHGQNREAIQRPVVRNGRDGPGGALLVLVLRSAETGLKSPSPSGGAIRSGSIASLRRTWRNLLPERLKVPMQKP